MVKSVEAISRSEVQSRVIGATTTERKEYRSLIKSVIVMHARPISYTQRRWPRQPTLLSPGQANQRMVVLGHERAAQWERGH